MSLHLRSLVAGLACVAAFVGLAPAAQAASSPEYLGVNLQPLMKDTTIAESRWDPFFDQLRAGQMTVSRIDINWNLVEAAPPVNGVHTYNWNSSQQGPRGSIDYLMLQAARFGIRAVPTFTASPTWAWEGGSRLPDARFGDFADFITAFAARYGPGGAFWAEHRSLTPLPVQEYEIWNEPNSTNSWTGAPDAPAYARLLQVVYPKLKAAQPGARVHASVAWPEFDSYLSALWASGAGGVVDGIAFHPYAPHAPETIGLTVRLRAKLAALGRPDLPILITETGQPATYTGPGAAHSYAGKVSDNARAGTIAFAADAIGRSDCGVEQYLVYAVTGSETEREIINEGFMGVLRHADGAPNVTGAALQTASRRWVQFLAAGGFSRGRLGLCSGQPTPDAALLPLGLTVKRSSNTCVTGTVTYDGHPLEAATLTMSGGGSRKQSLEVNAFGTTDVCLPNGPAVKSVDVTATVPNAARSATVRCEFPIHNCVPINTASAARAKACTWNVELRSTTPRRVRGSDRSKAALRAKPSCAQLREGQKVTFLVGLKPKGKKREIRLRTVTLRNGKTVKFSTRARMRKGDRITLLYKGDPALGLPRTKQTVALKAPRR